VGQQADRLTTHDCGQCARTFKPLGVRPVGSLTPVLACGAAVGIGATEPTSDGGIGRGFIGDYVESQRYRGPVSMRLESSV